MKKIFIILCVLFLSSCTNKEGIEDYNFKETVSINSEKSRTLDNKIVPRFVTIYENKIVFCDMTNQTHFYVYSLPDLKFLGSFGNENDAVGSIKNPSFNNQIQTKSNENLISVLQMDNYELVSFDLEKALNKTLKKEDVKSIILPDDIDESIHVLKMDNDLVFGSGYSNLGEFFTYNLNTKQVSWKKFTTDFDEEFMNLLQKSDLLGIYKHGMIKAKPDNSKFVKAYRLNQKISIFDNNGDLIRTIENKNAIKPAIGKDNQFSNDTNLYYSNVYTTDNYIYALCLNSKVNTNPTNVEIHVFDWNGNSIQNIQLNKGIGGLAPFAVDEKNRTIYTINPESELNYLSEFKY